MIRDRRGVGVAEYALLLFLVIAVAGLTFKYLGRSVKHAGNKTEEQFQGSGNSNNPNGATAKNDKTAPGANSAGGAGSAGAGGGGTTAGAGGAGGAGKSGGAGGGGGVRAGQGNGPDDAPGDDDRTTPLWKIIGGVFVVLFCIGGYFAFRKQKSSG